MKKEIPLRKEIQEPTIARTATQTTTRTYTTTNLDEAIKAVYRKYGTDLPAFFRDAFREAARKHEKAANAEVHPQ